MCREQSLIRVNLKVLTTPPEGPAAPLSPGLPPSPCKEEPHHLNTHVDITGTFWNRSILELQTKMTVAVYLLQLPWVRGIPSLRAVLWVQMGREVQGVRLVLGNPKDDQRKAGKLKKRLSYHD